METRFVALVLVGLCGMASAKSFRSIEEHLYYRSLDEQAVLAGDLRQPSTNVSDIKFLLWTRRNPLYEEDLIFGDADSVNNSFYDPSKPTKILVHGLSDHGRTGWILRVRDEFLAQGDFNIISADWEQLVNPSVFYFTCAENAKPAGRHAAEFVSFLVSLGANLDDFHAIGYSLGAQMVGNLGHGLEGRMPRVTGLDPAGFLFHTASPGDKLSPGSAQFVDVIHSAGLWIGTDEVVGHVDFYPNSGKAPQPGCEGESIGLSCSHGRGPSGACEDNADRNWMGLAANAENHGVFYLRTNPERPFAVDL